MRPAALFASLLVVAGAVVYCESFPAALDAAESHQENVKPMSRDAPSSEGRENIVSFLSALGQARKNTNGRFRTQAARSRANGKRTDIKGVTEVIEELTDGSLPADKEKEVKDEVLPPSPLKEKDTKKAKKPPGKKSNRRACFWKYCN
ncbi:urotensin II-related peptide [Leucoraja erinacea]|uniref:urotensin II-related peptide n=1 Tax=Leucoraja erinaceus TaxID=7782 RepID=UPI002454198C|nr:urotensin II-related peptide [Leucoraja erinacea]